MTAGRIGPLPVIASRRVTARQRRRTERIGFIAGVLLCLGLLYGGMWAVIGLSLAIGGGA